MHEKHWTVRASMYDPKTYKGGATACVWSTGGENEKLKDLLAFGIARLCSTKTKQKMVPSMCVLLLFFSFLSFYITLLPVDATAR